MRSDDPARPDRATPPGSADGGASESPAPLTPEVVGTRGALSPGRESAERAAAVRRREARARGEFPGRGPRADPYDGLADPEVAQHAFAALAESVRDYAIFLMNPEGIITLWGEGARLLKWWTRDVAEGSHLRLLYPDGGSDDGTAEEHLREAAETGEYTGEGYRVRSDGSTFWAGVTLTALRARDGTLAGFSKVTRDLTAHRAAEAARRAALEAAEEASRLKSQFLATMSHEIRTPLTAIMAYTDILEMEVGGPLTSVQHEQLRKIRTSSQHLLGIINDVLDVARVEAGRMVVDHSRMRLGAVIADALVLVEHQAAARRVEVVDAVSGYSAQHWCWGDEERTRQILLNLLGNAIKFTGAGGRVTVSAGTAAEPPPDTEMDAQAGPWVYVRVEDTGHGIPPDRIEQVFEPFVQADMTLTRQHGGTGLGLAISRRLARLMGGDLTARSDVGVGSTFFLWLAAAPEKPSSAARRDDGPHGAGTLRQVREAVLGELERILHAYVARLRTDAGTPSARTVSETELEDHLASFLSDIAQTLGALDLASGAASDALHDGTAIQRTISHRHGRQRAGLGWSEDEVRREFQILREEVAAAVRRRVQLPRPEELEEVIGVLGEFLSRAELLSLEGHRGTAAG